MILNQNCATIALPCGEYVKIVTDAQLAEQQLYNGRLQQVMMQEQIRVARTEVALKRVLIFGGGVATVYTVMEIGDKYLAMCEKVEDSGVEIETYLCP